MSAEIVTTRGQMGRPRKTSHSWMTKRDALAECLTVLGTKRATAALQGMHSVLRPYVRQVDAAAWSDLRQAAKAVGVRMRVVEASMKRVNAYKLAHSEDGDMLYLALLSDSPPNKSPTQVLQFIKYFDQWRDLWKYIFGFVKSIEPAAWLDHGGTPIGRRAMTGTITDFFAAFERAAATPLTGRTVALLAIGIGLEPPARDVQTWERARKRWDEALSKARSRAPAPRSPMLDAVLHDVMRVQQGSEDDKSALKRRIDLEYEQLTGTMSLFDDMPDE